MGIYTLVAVSFLHELCVTFKLSNSKTITDMSQNCDCNDYSLLTAKTGVTQLNTANPNLDGTGTLATVITAGSNGTIVRSIIFKALAATTTGMIRLFIGRDNPVNDIFLYREIPIPVYPDVPTTPIPTPLWQTLEIDFVEDIKLQPNYVLYASTQNKQIINVIAEAADWTYPVTLPDSCCNFMQETANTGIGQVAIANTKVDGQGAISAIFTAGGDGAIVRSITIAAQGSTLPGMVRLFVSPDGNNYSLMAEVTIPETNQSAFQPSYKVMMPEHYYLQSGYKIGASTQLSEPFSVIIDGVDWSYPIS